MGCHSQKLFFLGGGGGGGAEFKTEKSCHEPIQLKSDFGGNSSMKTGMELSGKKTKQP